MVARLAAHCRPEILLAKLWIMKMLKSPASQLIVIKVMITFVRASAPKTRRVDGNKTCESNQPISYKKRWALSPKFGVQMAPAQPTLSTIKKGHLNQGGP